MTATPAKQDYEIRAGLAEVKTFDVVGISIVTDNTRATEDINALWERFFTESVGQQILDKTDDAIYAVYSDYQGNHEAPYRLTIGYRIKHPPPNPPPQGGGQRGLASGEALPAVGGGQNFHTVKVKPGQYAILSAAGEQPKALLETWEAIWSSDLERSFATDFELYGPRFFEMGVNEVLVHVGVKS